MGTRDERDIERAIEEDPYFRAWDDVTRLFNREVIEDAISVLLGVGDGTLPPLPDARERAMAKLALFQLIAPHLDEQVSDWLDVYSRLSREEIAAVEQLLDRRSLAELLE